MSGTRAVGFLLLLAGAGLGSAMDSRAAAGEPPRVGAYVMLAADFHVHAFPGDGALPPWDLAREAARRGLHAVVVSNHNQTWTARLALATTSANQLPVMIPAQEVTTPTFHAIAAGVTDAVDWSAGEVAIADAVHAQGGVIIAAHPVSQSWRAGAPLLERLDGVEVAHPLTDMGGRGELDAFFALARATKPGVAPIGSSDFHMVAPLGVNRTYVFAESVTVDGVLDAVRAGRTVAEDRHGALFGDAALVAEARAARPAPVRPSPWRWASVALALAGLLMLVVLA